MRDRAVVQLTLRWGDQVLATTCSPASSAFMLGEDAGWALPEGILGDSRFELLRPERGAIVLMVPPRSAAWVADDGGSRLGPEGEHRLWLGSRARVDLGSASRSAKSPEGPGSMSVDVEVMRAETPPSRRAGLGVGAWLHYAASACAHVAAFAVLAMLLRPPGGDPVDDEAARARIEFFRAALGASAAREDEHASAEGLAKTSTPRRVADDRAVRGSAAPVSAGEGSRGAALPPVPRDGDGSEEHAPAPLRARHAVLREAGMFGILKIATLGLISSEQSSAEPARSPWESTGGTTMSSTALSMYGGRIEDALPGGLALSGTGEGGGGKANVIELGEPGAFGRLGTGVGEGFSRDFGIGGQWATHVVRAPRIRDGDGCVVNGRLPADVIQRVVRANMGRFRFCYESGLVRHPGMSGRVDVRFRIGGTGEVTLAADAGSSLPDPTAVSCIVAAFQSLAFPEPTGGTVTVEYPLTLSPE